jgi:hypothetical protein
LGSTAITHSAVSRTFSLTCGWPCRQPITSVLRWMVALSVGQHVAQTCSKETYGSAVFVCVLRFLNLAEILCRTHEGTDFGRLTL